MIQEKYFCSNRANPNILNYLSTAGPLPDTGRMYINRPALPSWPAFLVRFPAIQTRKKKAAPAGPSGAGGADIHYPQAPEGKTALNDSLSMTIGGVRYTVKSIFSENGGDFREMLEAAVLGRAARSLSAGGTVPPQSGIPAGQEA